MTSEPVIVCRDCGAEVARATTYLVCDCRLGFVAQWDQSLGETYADQAKHGLDRVRLQLQVYF